MSSGIGLINSHTLSECNKSSYLNDMDGDVENVDASGGHCFMNNHTLYEANNNNSIYSTNKRDGNAPNIS